MKWMADAVVKTITITGNDDMMKFISCPDIQITAIVIWMLKTFVNINAPDVFQQPMLTHSRTKQIARVNPNSMEACLRLPSLSS